MEWQDITLIAVTVCSIVMTLVLLIKHGKAILRFLLVLLALGLTFALLLVVMQTFDLWPTISWQSLLLGVLQ